MQAGRERRAGVEVPVGSDSFGGNSRKVETAASCRISVAPARAAALLCLLDDHDRDRDLNGQTVASGACIITTMDHERGPKSTVNTV